MTNKLLVCKHKNPIQCLLFVIRTLTKQKYNKSYRICHFFVLVPQFLNHIISMR